MTDVKVGVAVLVVRNNRVLLGRRIGSHGAGTWGLPGGKPEAGETTVACGARELTEETSMEAGIVRETQVTTRDFFKETSTCWETHFVEAYFVKGEPVVCEPNKCVVWGWFEWDKLPENLFPPLRSLVEKGFVPSRITVAA
ncbi:hypothetical protein [Ralstonia phage RP12]|uniref:Nudix hydrolase domain-containing protein n=1 Tax=Ralstonia phage RP12 TaxID=1923889 RepID=A0A1L7N0J3_9CAUD|nr:MutT/NUDIX hydrolase [Ralstonia phage RP12]BAW18976.1 hypothetical protein [Ralstonia phage RP12]